MIFWNEKTTFWAIKTRSSKSRNIDIFPKWLVYGFDPKLAIFPKCFSTDHRPWNEKTTFQFKKSKKWTLLQRSQCMILVQNLPFSIFFLGNIDQENVFYDILKRKNNFLGYKNKKQKSRKINIFLKELVHGFGQKLAIFPKCFSTDHRPWNEKTTFQSIKIKSLKIVEKLTFFQTWPLGQLLSKIGQYSNFFCLGNIGQENLFHDILERKNNFLGYKNKKFKKSKIYIFPRGVVHAFGP